MAIEREASCLTQRFNQRRAHGEIGHKMAIHDIDMDNGSAARRGPVDLVGKVCEIRGENRGCKLDRMLDQN
jgi:hypothetical protein